MVMVEMVEVVMVEVEMMVWWLGMVDGLFKDQWFSGTVILSSNHYPSNKC